jgi:hypothetical protein
MPAISHNQMLMDALKGYGVVVGWGRNAKKGKKRKDYIPIHSLQ